ncbi:MAG: glycoside hydrolase family 2 TIM barrel-domain containing protein [Saprospiraceae bacterium]|nr:glycoside hydrolase family 2 TIM barrel-domain containing protein [Saprospiraceae bacterium]
MKEIKLFSLIAFLLFSIFNVQAQPPQNPIKVEIRQENGAWQLYRGGEPYYINGVGGQSHLDRAVAYGANSVRTWGAGEAIAVLDDAHAKGLTVLFGLWVGCERQGFDYDDAKGVQAQLERFTEVVKEYKDHPAILMWGIGNETDLFYSDFKVWNAINDIAKMVHEVDPNHPTMTVTAGLDVAEIQLVKERAPHIDVFGINTYGGLIGIDKEMRAYGWEKPYVITEWGPDGHWEVAKTDWGVPIEQTSSEKARFYKERYEKGIANDKEMCIGSYVFLWGQKQETTPTWYGVFLEDGTETEVMDVLEYEWSGKMPENRSPRIESIKLENKVALESVYVKPGKTCQLVVDVKDPDQDELKYRWEILPESTDIKSGGDAESRPEPVEIVIKPGSENGTLNFKAPKKEGPYRLFTYIYDGNGNAATANIPFFVRK